jgi:hypothetical protein
MSIDAGIYQLAGRGVKSVAEYDAEASRAKQNKLAEMMGGMKMDEAKRGIAGENALAQLLAGGKSGADVATGLAAQGFGKQSMAYTKQSQDLAKDKVTMEKEQLAMTVQKLSLGAQLLGGVKDQASYDQARTTAQANGLDVSRMPAQFDPAFVAQKLQEGQTVKEQLEQHWKAKGYDLDVQKVGETQRHNKTTEGLTANGQQIQVRGQNMTNSRARASQAQSASQHAQTLAYGGKPPAGYRWKADGTQEAIPGGPAGKTAASTEGERKAATLLQRLQGSEKQLSAALREKPDAAKPGLWASGLRTVGADSLANTVAVSSERQRVESAQLDMLDAALTLGTGAAYTKEQLEGYRKSYFPQIGDTKDNVRDKKDRLSNVIQAAKIAAGRAAPQASGGDAPANVDSLLEKYK